MQFDLFREDYRLTERVSRKSRHLRVEVRGSDEVLLVYPRWVSRREALGFLQAREDWVRQKLEEFRQREAERPRPRPLCWDGSGSLLLRGVERPLRLAPATLRRPQLRIDPEAVTLFCPVALQQQPAALERALRQQLLLQARSDARRWLEEEGGRLGVRESGLRINDPRTQWGSCNPGGTICLSWRLLMAPPEAFRYVVVHELCHLVHRDHSARFWALVARQMPDYQPQRQWLRDQGGLLQLWLPPARA